MIVSVLAVAFLIIVGFITFLGYRTIILRGSNAAEQDTEKCSICRERFDKSELLLRQIGDYKILFFCKQCILTLYADLALKN